MLGINLFYFEQLGVALGRLHMTIFSGQPLNHWRWKSALEWVCPLLEKMKEEESGPMLPKSEKAAAELLAAINTFSPLLQETRPPTTDEYSNLSHLLDRFHNVFEQEIEDTYTYLVTPVGAYSVRKLIDEAETHLSVAAQEVINDKQKEDFRLAGACLALDLYTACGFHAMRALEEEARIYHNVVTGTDLSDVPLGALINGDSRVPGSGLKTQFAKEGNLSTSPLGLIISLLLHINKIYRCPIMHPEMTLTYESAKQVFDIAATTISSIIADGAERFAKKKAAQAAPPSGATMP